MKSLVRSIARGCILGNGNNSSAVTALQHAIVKCNVAGITADGVYGPQTRAAMRWPLHTSRSRTSTFTCYKLVV